MKELLEQELQKQMEMERLKKNPDMVQFIERIK